MLNNGTILQQRYKIVKILGHGGMGAVYLGEDQRLPTKWAIKEMKKEGLSEEEKTEAAELFQTEARLLSELRHRNLPRIVDFFEQNEQLYLVMDFVEGQTLEQRMKDGGPIPLKFALEMSLQIADVLDYLHSREEPIVFRDFKPGNVMLTPNDEVKLIDFGIARVFKKEASTDTKALGTPGYAAPEQYGKGQSGPRTDIYAFGATLHHALTGRDPTGAPFQFAPITEYRQDLPAEFVSLLESCVQLKSADRPESAFAVKRVLEQLLGHSNSSALGGGRATTTHLGATAVTAATAAIAGPPQASTPAEVAPPAPMPIAATTPISVPVAETGAATGTVVSAPLVRSDSPVPQVIFSPKSLQTKELGHGDKATYRLKVKCDRAITLEANSPALTIFPDQLPAGTTTCTISLDSSKLEAGSRFEGAVEVTDHDDLQVPVAANIQAPKASLMRSVSMLTLCGLTLIPILNFVTTAVAAIIMLSTPKPRRQSLKLAWRLTLFFSLAWTIFFGVVIFGASQVDWSHVTKQWQAFTAQFI